MNDVDVLIWGSGITGSRLALSLAEAGVSVAVIPRGPASYPVFPGVGDADGAIQERSELESDLLNNAARSGATILTEETVTSFSPVSGPIRSVLTEHQAIDVRCVVFADGADPRVGRARGLLPDWEPWQLVHFAWQRVDGAASGFQAIAGKRGEWPWRGYLAGTSQGSWIGVGWNLQCEMDSHIHITELLADVRGSFPGVGELVGEPQVEVVPYEPRHLEGAFCAENVVAVGDLTGIVNPLSLRRVEISLKIADSASRLIEQALKQGDPIRFEPEMVRAMIRPFFSREMQRDSGPPMPPDTAAGQPGWFLDSANDRSQTTVKGLHMTAPIRVQHVSIPMPLGGNDEARKFYAETLGLTEIEPPAILGTERFVWFAVGDDGHEVHVYTMDPFVKSQPSQHFCVQVEDGAAFRIKLAEGGFPITETDPITNRPRFFTNDPFGNRVEITEINGDYS